MKNEKTLIYRDDQVIHEHKKRLEELLPKYQQLIRLYFALPLDRHSRVIPVITRNAYQEIKEQLRANLPPSLRDREDIEKMNMPGEAVFLDCLLSMRKAGDLVREGCFRITPGGEVEIDKEMLIKFEEEHSISVADPEGKMKLDKVVEALNDFEEYAQKTYSGISLMSVGFDGSLAFNPRWRMCDRDQKSGKLVLNLNTLALFETTRMIEK